jgi:hypothetical protein
LFLKFSRCFTRHFFRYYRLNLCVTSLFHSEERHLQLFLPKLRLVLWDFWIGVVRFTNYTILANIFDTYTLKNYNAMDRTHFFWIYEEIFKKICIRTAKFKLKIRTDIHVFYSYVSTQKMHYIYQAMKLSSVW